MEGSGRITAGLSWPQVRPQKPLLDSQTDHLSHRHVYAELRLTA